MVNGGIHYCLKYLQMSGINVDIKVANVSANCVAKYTSLKGLITELKYG